VAQSQCSLCLAFNNCRDPSLHLPSWYNNLLEKHIVQRTRDGALKLSVQCNALKITFVSSFSLQFFFIVAKTWEKNSCDL